MLAVAMEAEAADPGELFGDGDLPSELGEPAQST